MTQAVLDASVVVKWFRTQGESNVAAARSLRAQFALGRLTVVVPPLLYLELLNVAARRWHWRQTALADLVLELRSLRFEVREPGLDRIAAWTAQGLTAYDASYVALAEAEATKLITDDRLILAVASDAAVALSEIGD